MDISLDYKLYQEHLRKISWAFILSSMNLITIQ